ncbi:hypothetical protein DH2020_033510 [Rehmannia glutinosa]|uniref:RING-type E3 ubiquitin transferase n=1 Tax=Rehmannia glutinosa TaxID=99300 RepID=A0ABR0VE81_REHGL
MNSSWFYTSLCFFLSTCICTSSSSTPTTVSYTDHCSSFVPESTPTTSNFGHPVPNLQTSYFIGGEKLIGRKQPNQVYYNVGKSLILRIRPNFYKTIAEDVYKVEAFLYIRSPYQYYGNRSDSGYGGSYHRRNRARGSIKFLLTGFWSEISRKLCMVGSGSFEALNLDVVLKYEMECRGSQDCSPLGLSRRFLDFSPIQCSERKLRFMAKLQNINYVDPEEFGFESTFIERRRGMISSTSCLALPKTLCPVKKLVKKGNIYPDGHSYDMGFDMSVKNSKGKNIAWGSARPISVGNDLFGRNSMIIAVDAMAPEPASEFTTMSAPAKSSNISPSNISYKISINPSSKVKFGNWFPNVNLSTIFRDRVEITAEGVYNAETGYLCMVGCSKLVSYVQNSTHTSTDCEVLVKFQFAPLNEKKGGLIKGTIESTRNKTDPLHFEDLSLSSVAYYTEVAEKSIWRMDLEITMVLISNTLSCIFIGLQIFHVKRNPEVLSCVSLVMLLILSLGHMIPLVLNFEALFLGNHNKQTLLETSGGWVEANEVAVRVITMVAFLLQIRLFQLVWTAKQNEGNDKNSLIGEKKSVFVSLSLYILGGLLTLLLNWTRNRHYRKYSLWGDLRSYAGLILDGFLLPQIFLNTFRGSAEKALSEPFYVGTSVVRLLPHAYNQYRGHNYAAFDVNGTYYYANPAADFYSTAWDVLIPCGVIALAVIVFLQQRNGGRWILPRKFRELELYEKVPVVNNE